MTVPRPHAIVTACDARCGDFLVRHWLRSLRDNVDLRAIDVVVLDFGLTPAQRSALADVVLVPARLEGRINVARRRELACFLESRAYDQVLSVDGGDVIFQGDVSPLFETDKARFRGVVERYPLPVGLFLRGAPRAERERVRQRLAGRPMINGGFVLGPAKQFATLGEAVVRHLPHFRYDQPIVSGLLYEAGFEPLPDTCNFVPWTSRERFRVEQGFFYGSDGEKLLVVHNTGRRDVLRVVRDFGYGVGYNRAVRTSYLRLAAAYRKLRGA